MIQFNMPQVFGCDADPVCGRLGGLWGTNNNSRFRSAGKRSADMRILRGHKMNIRPQFLACIFGITFLSGCELVVFPLAVVAAPIVYTVEQSKVVQPVTVVSSSGEQLTPSYGDAAEAEFTVTEDTITCTFYSEISEENFAQPVPIQCENGFKGKMSTKRFGTSSMRLVIGPNTAPSHGYRRRDISCTGYFNATDVRVDPFLLSCSQWHKDIAGEATLSAVSIVSGSSEFKVWINPPH
jgi:hypothetical protein